MEGNGEGSAFAENMKNKRMRRLSVVNKANLINENGEMGCAAAGSDGEHELRSTTCATKRFKLPKKLFYDCNTVDHVPRKLRSAMKKRNHDSILPPSPDDKPYNRIDGDGFPRKIGTKKSRPQGRNYSNGSQSLGPITKDEEEVVETLYALADMFPSSNENGSDDELTEAKSQPLPERENSKPPLEAPEEKDSKSLFQERFLEGSDHETAEVKFSNGSSLPGLPKSMQLQTNCEDATSHKNGQAMSESELSQKIGSSNQPKHEEAAACARKPEAAGVGNKSKLQYVLEESRYSSLPLAGSHAVGTQGPSLPLPRDITFLGAAVSATPSGSVDNCPISNKDSRGPVARKKSWKRCLAHVYISRLIKVLQIAEKTDRSPAQLTSKEECKQGVLLTTENLCGVRNGLDGFVSGHSITATAAENNTNEVRNESPLHKRLLLDQQQASMTMTSPLYASQKQNFDFLSLSNGGGGIEASNSLSKKGTRLEPSTQIQIPYPFIPFSVSENCFSSALSTYHLEVAAGKQVHTQSPPYMGSQLLGSPHLSNPALPEQQQQWIWTPQLARAQQNPVESCIRNCQHGRHEYPSSAVNYAQNLAGSQPIISPFYSPLEVLGPKYVPISHQQQQQQLISLTSSPLHTTKSRRQYHHLPSGFDINGVGFYSDAARPSQLVSNNRL